MDALSLDCHPAELYITVLLPAMNYSQNEQPRGKPRGITERNTQEHAQQAAGYSSSRKSGIKFLKPISSSTPIPNDPHPVDLPALLFPFVQRDRKPR
jgi:hypothetical protein